MTKEDRCLDRPNPLSHIIREKCPESIDTHFRNYDTDYKLFNEQMKRMMIIEEKCNGGTMDFPQNIIMKREEEAWRDWCIKNGWDFWGYNKIELSNCVKEQIGVFPNGKPAYKWLCKGIFKFNNEEMTEEELVGIMSMY